MYPERIQEILDEIAKNPSRGAEQIHDDIIKEKNRLSNPRGPNSEVIASFLMERVQGVTKVSAFHFQEYGLDWDLVCEFIDIKPVKIQVKSSHVGELIFLNKVTEALKKHKNIGRWVLLNLDMPFDDVIVDFVSQVNGLEGRDILNPVKF